MSTSQRPRKYARRSDIEINSPWRGDGGTARVREGGREERRNKSGRERERERERKRRGKERENNPNLTFSFVLLHTGSGNCVLCVNTYVSTHIGTDDNGKTAGNNSRESSSFWKRFAFSEPRTFMLN
jgi:hypothetical protein